MFGLNQGKVSQERETSIIHAHKMHEGVKTCTIKRTILVEETIVLSKIGIFNLVLSDEDTVEGWLRLGPCQLRK